MNRIRRPLRVPAPGLQQSLGLGQAIKRLTTAIGIRPCGGCGRRAASLDRRVVLVPTRKR